MNQIHAAVAGQLAAAAAVVVTLVAGGLHVWAGMLAFTCSMTLQAPRRSR